MVKCAPGGSLRKEVTLRRRLRDGRECVGFLEWPKVHNWEA